MQETAIVKYKGQKRIKNPKLEALLEKDSVNLSGSNLSIEEIEEATKLISEWKAKTLFLRKCYFMKMEWKTEKSGR